MGRFRSSIAVARIPASGRATQDPAAGGETRLPLGAAKRGGRIGKAHQLIADDADERDNFSVFCQCGESAILPPMINFLREKT